MFDWLRKPKPGEIWYNPAFNYCVEVIRIRDREVTYSANGCEVTCSIKSFKARHEKLN